MKLVEESCTAREEFYSITTQHNQYIDTTDIETNQEKQEIVHHYFITEAEDVESHIYESIEELSEDSSDRQTDYYKENAMRICKLKIPDSNKRDIPHKFLIIKDYTYNVIPENTYSIVPDDVSTGSVLTDSTLPDERFVIIKCETPEKNKTKIPEILTENSLSGSRLVNINISQGLEYLQLEKHCFAGRFHSFRNNKQSKQSCEHF